MKQKNYFSTFADFLHDEDFIAWQLFHTKEQDAYWNKFRKENPQYEDILNEACRYFDTLKLNDVPLSCNTVSEIHQRIVSRIDVYRRKKQKARVFYVSFAAGVLLLIALGIPYLLHQNSQPAVPSSMPATENRIATSVQLISNGEIITLNSNSSITLTEDGKASIVDSTRKIQSRKLSTNKTNKLIVPYGKRSFITLDDGTKIWLNSGTELSFPSSFASNSIRSIHVKGEIYLEVATSAKPFVVNTERSQIEVLGTAFNVSAYNDDRIEQVVLVHGSVNLCLGNKTSVRLHPNELATISANKCEITEHIDVSHYTLWRKGAMVFSQVPINEILKKLERYYNVSFNQPPHSVLKTKTVSGKLFLSNNIDSVLTTISLLSSVDYKREGNQITFIEKK